MPYAGRTIPVQYVVTVIRIVCVESWWRHQMEIFSALLALCVGNSPVTGEFPHKGQWRGALMFSLIYVWINRWVNNREAGDLRRHGAHYDAIVMISLLSISISAGTGIVVCRYWCVLIYDIDTLFKRISLHQIMFKRILVSLKSAVNCVCPFTKRMRTQSIASIPLDCTLFTFLYIMIKIDCGYKTYLSGFETWSPFY